MGKLTILAGLVAILALVLALAWVSGGEVQPLRPISSPVAVPAALPGAAK